MFIFSFKGYEFIQKELHQCHHKDGNQLGDNFVHSTQIHHQVEEPLTEGKAQKPDGIE
jgi:hypothetical protein